MLASRVHPRELAYPWAYLLYWRQKWRRQRRRHSANPSIAARTYTMTLSRLSDRKVGPLAPQRRERGSEPPSYRY